jgi:hypothetical protein
MKWAIADGTEIGEGDSIYYFHREMLKLGSATVTEMIDFHGSRVFRTHCSKLGVIFLGMPDAFGTFESAKNRAREVIEYGVFKAKADLEKYETALADL